jgi:hypothetical protein
VVDCLIHFKGADARWQRLPAVPRVGDYIEHDARLWKIDAVVFRNGSTTWSRGKVDVFVLAASSECKEELEKWSAKNGKEN